MVRTMSAALVIIGVAVSLVLPMRQQDNSLRTREDTLRLLGPGSDVCDYQNTRVQEKKQKTQIAPLSSPFTNLVKSFNNPALRKSIQNLNLDSMNVYNEGDWIILF